MSRPSKRSRREDPEAFSSTTSGGRAAKPIHAPLPPLQVTKSVDLNFRSLSTCNRCRIRKHRCDQRLPICANCEKVGVLCIGYDPVTKKEIPRSYVYHLETRVATLESILDQQRIPYPPANIASTNEAADSAGNTPLTEPPAGMSRSEAQPTETEDKTDEFPETLDMIVGSLGLLPTQGSLADGPNSDTCASSISFARLAFSSVQSSVAASSDHRRSAVTQRPLLMGSKSHHRAVGQATPFPDRLLGLKLVHLYFHHSNPMYPILHRKDFRNLFDRAYASQKCTARELFILNIVFAIGSGIHLTGDSCASDGGDVTGNAHSPAAEQGQQPPVQPEDYYATAITHLDSFLTSTTGRRRDRGLEELQAVLLLAAFALLRPASPGLWYIVGISLRRAVDLGLYSDHQLSHTLDDNDPDSEQVKMTRDFQRRLWWCAYSFDRLISACVGRPCSVPDSVITTEFPSLLDDDFISLAGFDDNGMDTPDLSYKHVSHHYFRLRMLQSEILQVNQAMQAHRARKRPDSNCGRASRPPDPFLDSHGDLFSPFPRGFASLGLWRDDVERRLDHWRDTVPEESTSGVTFPTEYFDLNYWQTIIMLYSYRQTIPFVPSTDLDDHIQVSSIEASGISDGVAADENEQMFLKIAEASQAVLRLYRELHLRSLVNYTYLDTHQLFTAGNAFLSAIWLSPTVRERFSVADIDLTVLAATSVFTDLVEKCPHAAACRDAIQKMSKATLKRCRLSRNGRPPSRRRLIPPRPLPTVLSSSFPDDHRSLDSHGSSGGNNHIGPASSVTERKISDSGSSSSSSPGGIRPQRVGDGIGSDMPSTFNDPLLPEEPSLSSRPPVFSNGHHHSPTAPPPMLLPELDRTGTETNIDYQHHDPGGADNFLDVSWNDDHLDFIPSAQVELFDSFFFGDVVDL